MSNKQLFFWSIGLYSTLVAVNISGNTYLLLLIWAVIALFCFRDRFLHVSLVLALPFAGVLQRSTLINQLSLSFALQGMLIAIFCMKVAIKHISLPQRPWFFLHVAFVAFLGFSALRNRYNFLAWSYTFNQIGFLFGGLVIFHYIRTIRQVKILLKLIMLIAFCSYTIALLQWLSGGTTVINLERKAYTYITWNMQNKYNIYGTALDSTVFGRFMWVGWCISLFMTRIEKGGWKILMVILLLAFAHGIYLSHSREAALAAVLAMFLYCVTQFWIKRNKTWLLGGLITIVLSYFVAKYLFAYFKNIATYSEMLEQESRLTIWPVYFRAFTTNPLLGVGMRIFTDNISEFGFYVTEGLTGSSWLITLAEQGILGLASFGALFLYLWWNLLGGLHARVGGELRLMVSLFLTLSIIYSISGLFTNALDGTFFWMTFFLGYRLIELKTIGINRNRTYATADASSLRGLSLEGSL
ncbi:O-antigen ligase family protein [Candidatus Poribacteria bacterium]|nr:O-antigen ligase family protein [Candidatus Poribacteria bacterium]